MGRIKVAMKNKAFRDLLIEYANEISDPANKKVRVIFLFYKSFNFIVNNFLLI